VTARPAKAFVFNATVVLPTVVQFTPSADS
jgi:hypothetical protein